MYTPVGSVTTVYGVVKWVCNHSAGIRAPHWFGATHRANSPPGGVARCVASTLQAGFFLKEKSAIVRAACRNVLSPTPSTAGEKTRQRLLCSGASISDSAEENLVHHLIVAILESGCRGGLNA